MTARPRHGRPATIGKDGAVRCCVVKMPPALYSRLREQARLQGGGISRLVRRAVTIYLAAHDTPGDQE